MKIIKRLIGMLLLVGVVLVGISIGPYVYNRLFGTGNIEWVSERFSEVLKEKNELVVYETTLTGQETVSKTAWLVGTVQQVLIPYTYSIRFLVDLNQSRIQITDNTIEVLLPPPRADYAELKVDEAEVKRKDWLYPLTPERYASIEAEIGKKLYDECANNPAYKDSAWASTVKNIETLFSSFVKESNQDANWDIMVTMEPAVNSLLTEQSSSDL